MSAATRVFFLVLLWASALSASGRLPKEGFSTPCMASASVAVAESWYDPQVEFLEVAAAYQGRRTWLVHGPDLDGRYGGLQGTGGLEGTVREGDGAAVGVVNDHFGHGVARVEESVKWSPTVTTGYGPALGFEPAKLSYHVGPAEAAGWRGRRADATGLYWLGARYYDPVAGRFVSPDPLGHAASLSLYDYAGNDPVNGMDPDGRLGKAALGLDAGIRDPYSHAFNTGFLQGVYEWGSTMGHLATMGPGIGSTLGGALLGALDGIVSDAFADHTSRFDVHQGNLYGFGSFVGEVAPNAIPVVGAEGLMARGMSGVNGWLATHAPRMVEDIGSLAGRLLGSSADSTLSRFAGDFASHGIEFLDEGIRFGEQPFAAKTVATPHGPAVQAMTAEAQAALRQVQSGSTVFRQGEFGVQNTLDAQFWGLRNPATTPGFAGQFGMPGSAAPKVDWIMGGTVRPGSFVITRPAPGIGGNLGGSMEAVVPPGGVRIDWFHMP